MIVFDIFAFRPSAFLLFFFLYVQNEKNQRKRKTNISTWARTSMKNVSCFGCKWGESNENARSADLSWIVVSSSVCTCCITFPGKMFRVVLLVIIKWNVIICAVLSDSQSTRSVCARTWLDPFIARLPTFIEVDHKYQQIFGFCSLLYLSLARFWYSYCTLKSGMRCYELNCIYHFVRCLKVHCIVWNQPIQANNRFYWLNLIFLPFFISISL